MNLKVIKTMVKGFSVWFIQSLIRMFTLGFYHKSLPRPLIEILREPFLPKTAHFLEKHGVRFIEGHLWKPTKNLSINIKPIFTALVLNLVFFA